MTSSFRLSVGSRINPDFPFSLFVLYGLHPPSSLVIRAVHQPAYLHHAALSRNRSGNTRQGEDRQRRSSSFSWPGGRAGRILFADPSVLALLHSQADLYYFAPTVKS